MAGLSLFKRESKFFSKINLFSKWFTNDLSKQNVCKKILFYKILTSPSFKRCRFKNALESPILLCPSKEISKQVSKPFDLNSFLKMFCFTKQRFLQQTLVSKTYFKVPNLRYKPMVNLLLTLYFARGKFTMSVGSQVT